MSELCDGIGHRLSGSKSLERAVTWAEGAMRADGLDSVWLQPVEVPLWVRGRESATIVEPGPHAVSMLGLGRSVGTPRGGITAEVVAVRGWQELATLPDAAVRGRIVLYNAPFTRYGETVRYRSRGADSASARGAVAALVRSVGPVSLRTAHTGTTAGYSGSVPRIPAAAVAIEDAERIQRLVDRGERVRLRLEMEADTLPDGRSHNVIGEIRGRERPGEIVVIGGHLDSWDVGAGAHDDAGGCVISMEALRLIRGLGLRPRRTLRCVLWTNEENGTRGAKAYAAEYGARERHVAALESDGGVERPVGFGVKVFKAGTDTTDVAATAAMVERVRPLGRHLAGIGATAITDAGGGADIEPLMKLGVPGFAHRTVMEHYFDWHHTEADMLDKVDPFELRRNVAAMAIMAWLLAEMEEPPGAADAPDTARSSR
jgi:carboxypeptidase Q